MDTLCLFTQFLNGRGTPAPHSFLLHFCNVISYSSGTPLLKLEICRVLLGAGAAVAARDHSNRCPLHYAGSSLGVTQLLLDFGADPEAQVLMYIMLTSRLSSTRSLALVYSGVCLTLLSLL